MTARPKLILNKPYCIWGDLFIYALPHFALEYIVHIWTKIFNIYFPLLVLTKARMIYYNAVNY